MPEPDSKPVDVTVVDTNKEEWQLFPVEYINAKIPHVPLHNDDETGMMILKMEYAAGFTNPWHHHYCGHGFYILEGVLDTHQGQYGPGSWVWFPEGGPMYHGATKDQKCLFLFITNKKFTIHYVGDKNDSCALEMAALEQHRKGAKNDPGMVPPTK